MKQVKICKNNDMAIEAALGVINGKATSFTILGFEAVEALAKQAECLLEGILAKKDRVGAQAEITGRGPSSSSYRYRATTTHLSLIRRATGWFLVDGEKVEVYPKTPERVRLKITPEQASLAKARFNERLINEFGAAPSEEATDGV